MARSSPAGPPFADSPPTGPQRARSVLVRALAAGLMLACGVCSVARADEIKVATWNLNWLTLRARPGEGLPPDVRPRGPEDLDRLAGYAGQLDADVIAVEEVDGWDAAARLFPRDRYSVHMTHDHIVQRVGIVVRRGLRYDRNPDVTALSSDPGHRLRSGADITLHLPGGELRILAVHLKTGCQDKSLRARRAPCTELREQIEPLQDWIAARRREGIAFLVLGDFNRRMEPPDRFIMALAQAAPLVRATEGRSSPCWGNEAFIDHILLGGAAREWLVPNSLRVMVYREQGREWQDRLSDHCPVSVRLSVPGGAAPAADPSPDPLARPLPMRSPVAPPPAGRLPASAATVPASHPPAGMAPAEHGAEAARADRPEMDLSGLSLPAAALLTAYPALRAIPGRPAMEPFADQPARRLPATLASPGLPTPNMAMGNAATPGQGNPGQSNPRQGNPGQDNPNQGASGLRARPLLAPPLPPARSAAAHGAASLPAAPAAIRPPAAVPETTLPAIRAPAPPRAPAPRASPTTMATQPDAG